VTREDSEVIQANGFNAVANGQDRLFVQLFVFYNSAGANLLAAQFKLRLDENEKSSAGLCHRNCGCDYLANRYERNINHHDIDGFGKVFHTEFASVPLDGNDARILPQLPVELFDVYVDGINAISAFLHQTLRTAPFQRPPVQANPPP